MSEAILRVHLKLCEETYDLLMEENSILKTGVLPGEAVLERKKDLLERLNHSVGSLREMNAKGPIIGLKCAQLVREAQTKIMKIFLLDRENEKMLLGLCSPVGTRGSGESPPIARESIRQAYERYAQN